MRTSNAYTLIEVMIYSALVAMIMGSVFATVHYFSNTRMRNRDRETVLTNERFLGMKIEALFNGVTAASVSPQTGTANEIQVTRNGMLQFVLDQNASGVRLRRDSNGDGSVADEVSTTLTNQHVTVTGFLATRTIENGQPVVLIEATLSGSQYSRIFVKKVYFL